MIKIYSLNPDAPVLDLPLVAAQISAGFPSPAADYLEEVIDLNREVIKNPSSTFLGRVAGVSMLDASINPADIVVIDKSLYPENNNIAVCYIDGGFTLKRIKIDSTGVWLQPENRSYKPTYITEQNNFMVWGIVTYIFKKVR